MPSPFPSPARAPHAAHLTYSTERGCCFAEVCGAGVLSPSPGAPCSRTCFSWLCACLPVGLAARPFSSALFLAAGPAGRRPKLGRGSRRSARTHWDHWPLFSGLSTSTPRALCLEGKGTRVPPLPSVPPKWSPAPCVLLPLCPETPPGPGRVWTKPTGGALLLPSASRGQERTTLPSGEEIFGGSGVKEDGRMHRRPCPCWTQPAKLPLGSPLMTLGAWLGPPPPWR